MIPFAVVSAAVAIIGLLVTLGTLVWKTASLSAQVTSKVEQLTEARVDIARLHALEIAKAMNESAIASLVERIQGLERAHDNRLRTLESQFPRQLRGSRPDIT